MHRFFLSQHDYHGLSVSRLLRMRARVLAKYAVQVATAPILRRRSLRLLAQMEGRENGQEAIIIALGPSASKLDADRLAQRQRSGCRVISLNHYALSDLSTIVPDYYVLADPHFFNTIGSREEAVWAYIKAHPSITLFLPDRYEIPINLPPERIRRFNGLGLEGFTRNISPLRPRGFLSMTAYHALSLAGFLGFSRILIIGMDNDRFRAVALTEDRAVGVRPHHFFDNGYAGVQRLDWLVGGMPAFFEDVARLFGDLWLFTNLPIENLDPHTLVDAFPVASDYRDFHTSDVNGNRSA